MRVRPDKEKKKKYEPPVPTRVGKKRKRGPDSAHKLPQGMHMHGSIVPLRIPLMSFGFLYSYATHTVPAEIAEARAHQGLPGDGARIYSEPRAFEAARGEEPGTDVNDKQSFNLPLAHAVEALPTTARC